MSKAGIYDQLTSEYGEKFTAEAAQYAIDNLQAGFTFVVFSTGFSAFCSVYCKCIGENARKSSIYCKLSDKYVELLTKSAIMQLMDT